MPTLSINAALQKCDPRLTDLSPDDELSRVRAERLAQMQQEHVWRQSGQGSLRELIDEVEFMDVLQPRDRGVVLVIDDVSERCTDLLEVFDGLAVKHVETQFCYLKLGNAGLLAHAVDLDEGVPVIFVLKYGQVIKSLPPSGIFELGATTSVQFRRHIGALLRRLGAICSDRTLKDDDSDSCIDSDGAKSLD